MHSHRILVVDDWADTAEGLAALLTVLGYDTQVALDGKQAIERAVAFRPHLILLDLVLPTMNGIETCRRIREVWWGSRPVIAAFTGLERAVDRERCSEAGFDDFLIKPVTVDAIQALLPLRE